MVLAENLVPNSIITRRGWHYVVSNVQVQDDNVILRLKLVGSQKEAREETVKKGTEFKLFEMKTIVKECEKCKGTGFTEEYKAEGLSIFCTCEKGVQLVRKKSSIPYKEGLKILKQTDEELIVGWLGVEDTFPILTRKAYICWVVSINLKRGTIKVKTEGDYYPMLTKVDSNCIEAEICFP